MPDLATIVEAWPTLLGVLRAGIVAMVIAAARNEPDGAAPLQSM
jgi:hypothetical protein